MEGAETDLLFCIEDNISQSNIRGYYAETQISRNCYSWMVKRGFIPTVNEWQSRDERLLQATHIKSLFKRRAEFTVCLVSVELSSPLSSLNLSAMNSERLSVKYQRNEQWWDICIQFKTSRSSGGNLCCVCMTILVFNFSQRASERLHCRLNI